MKNLNSLSKKIAQKINVIGIALISGPAMGQVSLPPLNVFNDVQVTVNSQQYKCRPCRTNDCRGNDHDFPIAPQSPIQVQASCKSYSSLGSTYHQMKVTMTHLELGTQVSSETYHGNVEECQSAAEQVNASFNKTNARLIENKIVSICTFRREYGSTYYFIQNTLLKNSFEISKLENESQSSKEICLKIQKERLEKP